MFFSWLVFNYFWLCWVFLAVCGHVSSCSKLGLLLVAVHGLLIAVVSVVCRNNMGSRHVGFSSCGMWAQ